MPIVKPIPEGFHSVSASITVKDAVAAIEFYKQAFGAEELMRIKGPNNSVLHAEIKVGDSIVMLADEWPGNHVQSPATLKNTTCMLHIYTKDVDAAHKRAVTAGATETMPPTDMFWGDRFSTVTDPSGHAWSLATHIKDLTPEECQKGCEEWMAQMAEGGQG